MGRFWGFLASGRPRDAAGADARDRCRARRRRSRPPEVDPLEGRELTTLLGISAVTASTQVLTPPDGRFVPVTFSGLISNNHRVAPRAEVHVVDEYRRVRIERDIALKPEGKFPNGNLYSYSFTVGLEASRADQDLAGRQYYVIITVHDPDNGGARVVPVVVPRDARHIPEPADATSPPGARPARMGAPVRRLTPGSARPSGRPAGPR
jgi:hypothetical protein